MIRILFLSANPVGTDHLLLSQEYNDINDSFRMAPSRDQFDLVQRPGISITDLQRIWMEYDPHILHFSGHGSDINGLVFENHDGNAEYVLPQHLSDLFKVLGKYVRLVFLNACYTSSQAEAISKHVDCVIGTVGSIGDNTARIFAKYFYQSIGFGQSVQNAFSLAKNQLNLFKIPEDHIPVLLARNGVNASETFFTSIHSHTNQGKQMQNDILKFKDNYKKLLEGDQSINEFWGLLFPFVNELLNGDGYKDFRKKTGQVSIDSLNRLLINLRDKIRSNRENTNIGDTEQAKRDERLFVKVAKDILDKLDEIYRSLA